VFRLKMFEASNRSMPVVDDLSGPSGLPGPGVSPPSPSPPQAVQSERPRIEISVNFNSFIACRFSCGKFGIAASGGNTE